ncbi:MAG TPA: MFS transporter, partial [Thermomicrobiaceae bacterium]|nr:MFS transporter [Thermomicrobiaceae bacterium]
DLIRAVAVATLPVAAHFGGIKLWQLAAVAVVLGGLNTLFNPALQASLPDLAGDSRTLQAANGLMEITRRLAKAVGPSLAGLLLAFIPISQFFSVDAVSFAISALAVLSLGTNHRWRVQGEVVRRAGAHGFLDDVGAAAGSLRDHLVLSWSISLHALTNLVWGLAFTVGVPLMTERVLHSGAATYGLIVGAYGVGNVLSNIVVGSITIRRRVLMLFAGNVVLGLGFVILAGAPGLLLAMFGSALAAVGGPMSDLVELVMIQTELPQDQIGKVFSLKMLVQNGGYALGLALAGPVFAVTGIRLGILICALLMAATGVAGLTRFGFSDPPLKKVVVPAESLAGKLPE